MCLRLLAPPPQAKLDRGEYSSPKEFKHDVTLVWTNWCVGGAALECRIAAPWRPAPTPTPPCSMTYNADGSEYYLIAQSLKKIFEEKYAKMVKEEGAGEGGEEAGEGWGGAGCLAGALTCL